MATALDNALMAWQEQPFPHGSADDDLDELHADLVLVDTWVAESVIPFVEHGTYTPAIANVSAGIARVRDRAESLERSGSGDGASLAHEYVRYADLCDRVYSELLHAIEGSG